MPLVQMTVSAVNCQVALFVPDSEDYAIEWPTGHEKAIANSSAVYVSTIPEMDGQVTIEVLFKVDPPEQYGQPIYDGTLLVRNAGALVGSALGNHLAHLSLLRPGQHRVRVYTDTPLQEAEHVVFIID